MPILHEKLPLMLVKKGQLLVITQHRFLCDTRDVSQIPSSQTQTFLHLIDILPELIKPAEKVAENLYLYSPPEEIRDFKVFLS